MSEISSGAISCSTFFQLEALGAHVFEGYKYGPSWNGWAVPLFPFDQATRIAEAMSEFAHVFYDDQTDEFIYIVEDDEERFGAVEMDGRKLYGIGAGSWMWEETV